MAHIYEAIVNHFSLQHGDTANLFYLPGQTRNAINDKLVAKLEKAREHFEEGLPDMGIPPLEPLFIEYFHMYIYQKAVFKADVTFDGIEIAGLKGFILETLNFKIVGLNLSFDFSIPQLVLTSTYRVDGKVASIIPFRPCGDTRVEVNNLRVKGVAALGVTDGYLHLKSFSGEFDVGKIKIYMSGLIGDGLLNKLVNWILSKMGTNTIQEQKSVITEKATAVVIEVANEVLQTIKLTDFIG